MSHPISSYYCCCLYNQRSRSLGPWVCGPFHSLQWCYLPWASLFKDIFSIFLPLMHIILWFYLFKNSASTEDYQLNLPEIQWTGSAASAALGSRAVLSALSGCRLVDYKTPPPLYNPREKVCCGPVEEDSGGAGGAAWDFGAAEAAWSVSERTRDVWQGQQVFLRTCSIFKKKKKKKEMS